MAKKREPKYDESAKFFSYGDTDQDLWLLFTHARYAVYRAREKELQALGTSPEHVGALFIIQALGEKATPSEIARQMIRRPHTVSALLKRMVKIGLIKEVKDLDRKNMVRAVLTDKGKRIYKASTLRGPIHRILGQLNDNEKKRFRKTLEKILAEARKEIGLDQDELPRSES